MADMFLVRDSATVDAVCRFLVDKLQLTSDHTVFDQCCGIGGLSIPLARREIEVIGVDQCQSYIIRATVAGNREELPVQYFCRDAFEFTPPIPCDAAFNWGSSFGNADTDVQNLSMIQRAFEALLPGGRFILDYQNIPGVLRGFKPSIIRRHATDDGDILLLRECAVSLAAGKLEQVWTYIFPDGQRVVEPSSLRLYLPDAIAQMLKTCGFTEIAFFGDIDGSGLSLDSPRCICLGTKP
jgi:SAM-dependent methyltransferase